MWYRMLVSVARMRRNREGLFSREERKTKQLGLLQRGLHFTLFFFRKKCTNKNILLSMLERSRNALRCCFVPNVMSRAIRYRFLRMSFFFQNKVEIIGGNNDEGF